MDKRVESSGSVSRGAANRSRRRWSVQEKVRTVQETLELFIWRSQYRRGELTANDGGDRAVKLLPVEVEIPVAPQEKVDVSDERAASTTGCMEIQIAGGRHVKIWGQIDAKALRVLVRELLRPC